ncbi:MAG: hypothetical protein NZP74_13425, partial [Anaerolineales bacterium]|nr:hypothetical protein [Anaerolineales bacterium]
EPAIHLHIVHVLVDVILIHVQAVPANHAQPTLPSLPLQPKPPFLPVQPQLKTHASKMDLPVFSILLLVLVQVFAMLLILAQADTDVAGLARQQPLQLLPANKSA